MSDITREDVERAIHKARSLVTVKTLNGDMGVVSGPWGRNDRPRALGRVRGMVKRQQINIALQELLPDGFTWRTQTKIQHRMGRGAGMLEAICAELNVTGD